MSDREMDPQVTLRQIGPWNVAAISGGRWHKDEYVLGERFFDIILPISSGYRVRIALAADDTYTVTREMKRGAKMFVKGVQTNVYCDELGEVCYQASSYKSNNFGAHIVEARSVIEDLNDFFAGSGIVVVEDDDPRLQGRQP